jgi:predicted aspartyl protease
METKTVSKVIVKLRLANNGEWFNYHRKRSRRRPRQVEIEALVDTGATRLCLKPSVIKALGLRKVDELQSQTTNGVRTRGVYDPVRLELLGRHGTFDVVDVDEHVPNLLGQVPLEVLDFVVDPKGRQLVANPAHGGIQMTEEY